MLQKTKSLLLKLLMLLCVACCAVALAFSLAGCSGVTVDRMEINDEGHLIVYYSDGSSADLGLVKGEDGQPGETPDIGTVVEDISVVGDTLTITYSDGTTQEYTIVNTDVTVTDIEIVDGAIVVTYSDGTTKTLEIPADDLDSVVVSVVLDEATNEIVVTYADGTETRIPAGVADDCAHENVEYIYQFEEHDCASAVANGYNIKICNDCGEAWFELIPAGHEAVETTKAPTCYSEGYTVDVCRYCGEELGERTNIVPAVDHEYDLESEGYLVAAPGGTLCEDGGWVVHPCVYTCGNVHYEAVASTGHSVEDGKWNVTLVPSESVAGAARGYCTECGEEVVITLPALTAENLSKYTYEITDDTVNCSEPMKAHFSYTDENGTTVEFDGTLPGGYHHLNGEAIDDSQVITYTGADSLPDGMEIAGNSNNGVINCTTEGVYAVFTCDDCGRPIVVNVRVPHTAPSSPVAGEVDFATASSGWSQNASDVNEDGIPVNADGLTEVEYAAEYYKDLITEETNTMYSYAASCEGAGHQGFRVYWCSVCEQAVADIIAIPDHVYTYTAAPSGEDIYIVADCDNCTSNGTITLENYTEQVITEVSCEHDGRTTYTGVVSGTPTGIFAEYKAGSTVTITAVTPQTNHVHPVYGTEFEDDIEDPNLFYNVDDYPDMELAANSGENCADSRPVYGVFVCEDCGETIVINMKWGHTEPAASANNSNVIDVTDDAAHDTASEAIAELKKLAADDNDDNDNTVYYLPATCENPGFRAYICADCGEPVADTTYAIGHDVEYTFTHKDGDTYTLTSTCANECGEFGTGDAGYIEPDGSIEVTLMDKEDVTEETETPYAYIDREIPATCTTPSSRTIVVVTTEDDVKVTRTFTETGDAAMHTLNGELMPEEDEEGNIVYYDPAVTEGIVPSGNYDLTCAGEGGLGVFDCDVCGRPIVVHIRDSHTAPSTKAALPEGQSSIPADGTAATEAGFQTNRYYEIPATCNAAGSYGYFCRECGEWVTGTIDQLAHEYRLTSNVWKEEDLNFTLTFGCSNKDCDVTFTVTLDPFTAHGDGYVVADGYTLSAFSAPSHNNSGFIILTYTVTFDDVEVADQGKVAKDFSFDVTLSGTFSRGDAPHFHIVETVDEPEVPVDPENPFDGHYYWYVSEYDENDNEISRTYYVGTICGDCGEMYSAYQTGTNLVNGKITVSDSVSLPESTNPNYKLALEEDAAADAEEVA